MLYCSVGPECDCRPTFGTFEYTEIFVNLYRSTVAAPFTTCGDSDADKIESFTAKFLQDVACQKYLNRIMY